MENRNREKLLEQNIYDVLCSMSANLRKNMESTNISTCIMYSLYPVYSEYEKVMRCNKHKSNCEQCIADYLNESTS